MSKRSGAFTQVTHYQVDIQYIGSRLGHYVPPGTNIQQNNGAEDPQF